MNKKTILFIDDEEINLQLFEINFSKKYDVITGSSGHEGLNCLNKFSQIKIVISDLKMPKMNGFEFIKQASKKYQDKSYFILTGYDITEEINHALKTGLIMKYFRKPFNIKEIETAIDTII
jgi:two-component system, response regulator, stage 0 sporulation protein F